MRIRLFIIGVFACLTMMAQQTFSLHGYVVDESGEPLPGAAVRLKQSRRVTISDSNGYFIFRNLKKGDKLSISFIGMNTKVIVFNGKTKMRIVMTEERNKLREVSVVAKANVNEIDLREKSGVVAKVEMKRLVDKPMENIGLALQGSVPGLSVINMGELGTAPKIRLRGNSSFRRGNRTNEPLYVLDGKIIDPDTFYNLNPLDVEDIKVLKDAAACALYGVKAANGVIEVSSKRGNSGDTRVTYNMNVGITTRGRRGIKLMSSSEKLELERRMGDANTPGYRLSRDYIEKHQYDDNDIQKLLSTGKSIEDIVKEGEEELNRLRGIDTDWFKELIRMNTYQRHNLSVRGGTEDLSYYLSVNYTSQGGRLKGNDKDRMGARLNMDKKIGKHGYLLMSVDGGYSKTITPNGTSHDPTALVYQLNPYETKTSRLYSFPKYKFNDLMHQYEGVSTVKDAGASATLTFNPIKGLDIMAVTGLDFSLSESKKFTPSTAISERESGNPIVARGIFRKSKYTTMNITNNLRLTYNKVWNEKHDFTIGGNMDYYMYLSDNISITGYGVGEINSASAINQSLDRRKPVVSAPKDKNAQLGFGLVSGYTYNSIYDIYGTFKADGSSVLPSDKRWNYAWGIGSGVNIHNYDFLKDNNIISQLSLKGSYGWMANLNGVSASETVGTFAYSTESYEDVRPLHIVSLYNKDLKAEQTKSLDLSLTLGLFKRVNIDVNWYNRLIVDALLDVPIPSSSGFMNLKRNIGSLRNRGIETRVSTTLYETDKWRLTLGASFAYNSNKVVSLYDKDKLYVSEESLMPDYEVGKAYDILYGARSLGINPINGYPVFLSNDDKEKTSLQPLTREDMISLGHTTPPYSGSINLGVQYGNFSIDADFYYVAGGVQRLNYSYVRDIYNIRYNAVKGQTEKMWFKPGDEYRDYWNPYHTNNIAAENISLYPNTKTIGKSNYLRMSMLSIRYRFERKLLERYLPMVKYANIAFQGSNLFTITPYKESDPETGRMAGTMQPVYTINLNLTF